MNFLIFLLNNREIKLGEQINPCCELDQWLRKLTFQHKVKRVRGWDWCTAQTHCRLLRSDDYLASAWV